MMMLITLVLVVAVLGFATNAPSVLTVNIFLKMTYFLENIFRKLILKMRKKNILFNWFRWKPLILLVIPNNYMKKKKKKKKKTLGISFKQEKTKSRN